ncbi:MAG: hypothetical protein ACXWV0_04660, partial [Flavisolibacter sp.]
RISRKGSREKQSTRRVSRKDTKKKRRKKVLYTRNLNDPSHVSRLTSHGHYLPSSRFPGYAFFFYFTQRRQEKKTPAFAEASADAAKQLLTALVPSRLCLSSKSKNPLIAVQINFALRHDILVIDNL